jgi:large subunit ribosomal protein L25
MTFLTVGNYQEGKDEMAVVAIKAEGRTPDRKGGARRVRREGRIPAILYGPGEEPKALSLDRKEMDILFRKHGGASIILELDIAGAGNGKDKALVKEVQRDVVTGQVLHLDLLHISATRKITVDVPLEIVGEAVGAIAGGVLEVITRDVQVECLPVDIPDKVDVDVSALEIGDSIKVRDLAIPNTEILNDPDAALLTIVPPTVYEEVKEEVAEEEEPELVSKEKEEAEAEAGEKEKEAEGKKEKE